MRILIIGINYAPELVGAGKYNHELAEWLKDSGYQVRVVTTPPYYPYWKIKEGYSGWKYKIEKINGVKIYRCPLWVPKKPSGITRILHLTSFGVSCFPVLIHLIFWKAKVICNIAPTFFTTPAALLSSRLSKSKSILHFQDFELDAAFSLKILSFKPFKKLAICLEKKIINAFDCLSTISSQMLKNLQKKGVAKSRCYLLPNWVDLDEIYPLNRKSLISNELKLSNRKTNVLYSGNMGKKQGIEILIDVAKKLQFNKKIQFIFCGQGLLSTYVKNASKVFKNIIWIPLQPFEKLNELLNMADIHLLPQGENISDFVMPSKLTGMLASGKPIVATANNDTEIAKVLKSCGIVVKPGDVESFANAIVVLAEDHDKRKKLGNAARKYAIENLSKNKIMRQFEIILAN